MGSRKKSQTHTVRSKEEVQPVLEQERLAMAGGRVCSLAEQAIPVFQDLVSRATYALGGRSIVVCTRRGAAGGIAK